MQIELELTSRFLKGQKIRYKDIVKLSSDDFHGYFEKCALAIVELVSEVSSAKPHKEQRGDCLQILVHANVGQYCGRGATHLCYTSGTNVKECHSNMLKYPACMSLEISVGLLVSRKLTIIAGIMKALKFQHIAP